jgi:glutamate:GABA antiporter
LTAGIGFAGVLFSFVVSFFPPDQLPVGSPALYTGLVVLGIVVFAGIPLIIHHVRRSDWAPVDVAPIVKPATLPLN